MQANLTRLNDLTDELRRQLKPLGRQAEIARRAAGVQAELRDSRLRLLADDLQSLQERLARDVADEEAITAQRTQVEAAAELARARESELELQLAEDAPLVDQHPADLVPPVVAARAVLAACRRWPPIAPACWPPNPSPNCPVATRTPSRPKRPKPGPRNSVCRRP